MHVFGRYMLVVYSLGGCINFLSGRKSPKLSLITLPLIFLKTKICKYVCLGSSLNA